MKDLSLHILDIVRNSIKADASKIHIVVKTMNNRLSVLILDNGKGISEHLLKDIFNPFVTTRTTRKVGMGLSLLKSNAELAGGNINIKSIINKGTIVKAIMKIDNIDRKPLGDLSGTIKLLILSDQSIDIKLKLSNEETIFVFDTIEIKKQIDGVEIINNEIIKWIEAYINEGIVEIFGGILNEIIS